MKSRTLKESLAGRRKSSGDFNENLYLVSNNRLGALPDVSLKSGKVAKNGFDDLMSPTDSEKEDSVSPFNSQAPAGTQFRSALAARKTTLKARSASTTRAASKLSGLQTESSNSSRPARSSSATRPSISAATRPSISASCPSSPLNSSPPVTRSSTPSFHKTLSRSSTPSTTSSVARTRSLQNARSSTSSYRPKIAEDLTASFARSSSCLPTPLWRPVVPSSASAKSGGLVPPNGQKSVSAPRLRTTKQPTLSSESPQTPRKLKASSAGRAVSTGRSRLEVTAAMKGSPGTTGTIKSPKKSTSPVVTKGKLVEPSGRTKGRIVYRPDSNVSDIASRKPGKSSTAVVESAEVGKTMTKALLETAIKRLDIQNGKGCISRIPSTTLYPHSVRSSKRVMGSSGSESSNNDEQEQKTENNSSKQLENGDKEDDAKRVGKADSARYEDLLLQEDVNSTNWLLSIDDDSSDSDLFFDPLPEPFDPL